MILSVFSDHNEVKLEVSNSKKTKIHYNKRKLNNTFLSNYWVK